MRFDEGRRLMGAPPATRASRAAEPNPALRRSLHDTLRPPSIRADAASSRARQPIR
ncbi:hypothetical protein C7S16_6889 [Burkholderia thailandensis]|uniref:Uncharacterized protein n=1 Tax=Burkholderia thailandensis TaxID=57975 RepID=A0AAW9CWY7_BURTH|nr:hypothetical protein [Burkholderia thailandensis]